MENLLRAAFPGNGVLSGETLRRIRSRSKLYVVFLTPRSGSTWLTELARESGVLGCPQEWFNESWIYTDDIALGCLPPRRRGVTDVNRYVDSIVDEGRGVVGLELSVFQALMLGELMDEPFDPGLLNACFYLRRQDKVAQAISLYRSASSGYFHSYQDCRRSLLAYKAVEYDFDEILKWLNHIEECEHRFEALFAKHGMQPERIVYEDLLVDPLKILNEMSAKLGERSIDRLPASSLKIMRDGLSEAWHANFVRDHASILAEPIPLAGASLAEPKPEHRDDQQKRQDHKLDDGVPDHAVHHADGRSTIHAHHQPMPHGRVSCRSTKRS